MGVADFCGAGARVDRTIGGDRVLIVTCMLRIMDKHDNIRILGCSPFAILNSYTHS